VTHRSVRPFIPLLVACAATLLSGAAALSYEVVWSRMLVLVFGNSADATMLVLCAFMVGMAAGARAVGRLADGMPSPLRIYVAAEALLALYAIAVPFLMPSLERAGALTGALDIPLLRAVARFAAAFCIVAVPALFMGATVPVLVRGLAGAAAQVRARVGLLYGANTLGGAMGAALCGFLAIPFLGLRATSWTAAGASLLAAGLGLMALRLSGDTCPAEPASPSPGTNGPVKWPLIAAAVGGFAMLGGEILWARLLTFIFGHDTYAFAILLVVVLAGLGLGGFAHSLLRNRTPLRVAGAALCALGITLLTSYVTAAELILTAGRDPFHIAGAAVWSTSLWKEFVRELSFAPLLVFAPAFFAGLSLPAACAAACPDASQSGRRTGAVLLSNGMAAAAGAVLTSTVFIPLIGIERSLIALSIVAAGAGSLLLVATAVPRTRWTLIPAVPGMAFVLAFALLLPGGLPLALLREAVGPAHQRIIHYEEGRTGTVSVTENRINKERQLFMNAVNEVTTRLVHIQSFKLLGHLGPLLHPHPRTGLLICFGAGVSAGAAIAHPFTSIDIVDLSETVFGAAPHFRRENNDVLADDRVHLHVEDGRQFLLRSEKKYDVMMIDSTHPKAVDSWILYTSGFYRLVKSRLAKDGIAVQWLPLHGLSETEFASILRTFEQVFPHMTLWLSVGFETYGKAAYAKLVGTHDPLQIDYRELSRRLKEPLIAADLARYGMDDPMEILDGFVADADAVRRFAKDAPVQTDDRPFVSYITPYSKGRRMDAASLIPLRMSPMPLLYRTGDAEEELAQAVSFAMESNGFLMAGLLDQAAAVRPGGKKLRLSVAQFSLAKEYYRKLATLYDDDPQRLFETASMLGNLGYFDEAVPLYRRALELGGDMAELRINLALALADRGDIEEAHNLLADAVADQPDSALARYNFGVILKRQGDAGGAALQLARAVDLDEDLWGARVALADAWRLTGRLDKAEARMQALTALAPRHEEAWDLLGLIAGDRGDQEQAVRMHEKALLINPYRADSHYNMGVALEKLERWKEAAGAYAAALAIDDRDAEAHNNLGLLFGRAGMYDEAAAQHLRALDIEPHYPEAAFNLGLAWRAAGKTAQAKEAFALALRLHPGLDAARQQLEQLEAPGTTVE